MLFMLKFGYIMLFRFKLMKLGSILLNLAKLDNLNVTLSYILLQ